MYMYAGGKKQQKLLDILACNSANKPLFKNQTQAYGVY